MFQTKGNSEYFKRFIFLANLPCLQLERKVKDWITFLLVEICWNILILVHSCRKMITRSDTQYFFENKDLETCVYTLQNVTQRRVAYSWGIFDKWTAGETLKYPFYVDMFILALGHEPRCENWDQKILRFYCKTIAHCQRWRKTTSQVSNI